MFEILLFLYSRLAGYPIVGFLLKQAKSSEILSFRKVLVSKDSDRPFPHSLVYFSLPLNPIASLGSGHYL